MDFAIDIRSLISDAVEGSTSAFAEIVERHQKCIRHYLARYANDPTVVDDLAQEVFLAAYRNLTKFDGASKFSTWLHGIARNKALEYVRSESRRRTRERKVVLATLLDWQAEQLNRENESNLSNFVDWLNDCLEGLPPVARQVIQQVYFEGRSSEDVGIEMNKNAGSIRMMLMRIRRSLHKCMTAKQSD